jgi:hypothetical protein
VVLACNAKEATIRLRGYQGERKITWDDSGRNTIYNKTNTASYQYMALINIGNGMDSDSKGVTLQLEQNITLDGEQKISSSREDNKVYSMITVYRDDTLIMKSGSKVTGYMHPGVMFHYVPECNPIFVFFSDSNPVGTFILNGGEITGNVVDQGVICASQVEEGVLVYGDTFEYISGKIYANTRLNDESTHGNYLVGYNEYIELKELPNNK